MDAFEQLVSEILWMEELWFFSSLNIDIFCLEVPFPPGCSLYAPSRPDWLHPTPNHMQ